MTPYQAACKRNRAYMWERLRYIFDPHARAVVPKRTNPIGEFPGRINAPGAGRPSIDPELKRVHHNAAQNARRAAAKPAALYICQDCGNPTGCRAGALRCHRCNRIHRCLVRNANRAAAKSGGRDVRT